MSGTTKDYAQTLNLPETNFSMRANLPSKEPEMIASWEHKDIYKKIMKNNAGKPSFVFHDGPPYANGDMHIGHALNKTLKDFIIKYKNMSGYCAPYIHGWDTHGLPIELQMIKKHKVNSHATDPIKFRQLCQEFARNCVETQKGQIKRLGSLGDYDNSYLTLLPEFEAKQIEVFGEMANKGYIYKGKKPVYWCPHDETALAEAEIEYSNDVCDSIYVKFKVSDDKGVFAQKNINISNLYFVIWTTTTWTLPGNTAICLGPEIEYSLMKYGDETYIFATQLVSESEKAIGLSDGTELLKLKGKEMEFMKAQHPFLDRQSIVIVGEHVTLESGTGCVHTAPGHGIDDFNVAQKYPELKKDIIVPVDSKGVLNELAGKYNGLYIDKANEIIANDLKERGALLAVEKITHQYPHCWRCKHPVIFRATKQWFCSIDGFKKEAINSIKNVKWLPSWGESRIENMVSDRTDWCISRQRIWGVPIPIFYCQDCDATIISKETIKKISSLFKTEGSDAWYKYSAEEILQDLCVCPICGSKHLTKESDIMDVWFDSGSSYASVLEKPLHSFPADLYLEGNDQYRGWFQSSLLTSVATRNTAPYKMVITHGMVVDGEGKKMSKSLGNGIDPIDITKEYGADILRLWVSSSDYTGDVRISKDILKQLSEIYRKIRNTLRILMANLRDPITDFDPKKDMIPFSEMLDIDKWALISLNELVKRVNTAYEEFSFHMIYHDIHNFCTIDMSKQYIDIVKDRLYVENKSSKERRSAQTAMYIILHSLTRLIAPILSFTAEEVWQTMSHLEEDNIESVLLNSVPVYNKEYIADATFEDYNKLFEYRDHILKALEIARNEKIIGKSLEAQLTIYGASDNEAMKLFEKYNSFLSTLFIVSKTTLSNDDTEDFTLNEEELGLKIKVSQAEGKKCSRCWMITEDCEEDGEGQFLCERCRNVLK